MVEIITMGRLPEDVKYTMKCRECKTVAIFERKEGRYSADQRDGDAIVFTCPICSHAMWHGIGAASSEGY